MRLLRALSVVVAVTFAVPASAQMSFEGLDLGGGKKKPNKKPPPKKKPDEKKPDENNPQPDVELPAEGLDLSKPVEKKKPPPPKPPPVEPVRIGSSGNISRKPPSERMGIGPEQATRTRGISSAARIGQELRVERGALQTARRRLYSRVRAPLTSVPRRDD